MRRCHPSSLIIGGLKTNMSQNLSLSGFLAQHLDHATDKNLGKLLIYIAEASKKIAIAINSGALEGHMGALNEKNVQGEIQKALDVISDEIFIETLHQSRIVAAIASEEQEDWQILNEADEHAPFLVLFDPLDGSSNVNLNQSVGSIFSVLDKKQNQISQTDFLRPGKQQCCAGYALYGTSTMLVFTVGKGVNGFTLDEDSGEFYLTHPDMTIPESTQEFAINLSNYRFWQPAIQQYIDECLQGKEGVRGKDFNMRWVASMVAEIHRILIRGGIFMYPMDSKLKKSGGKLRLMYEANPMAMLIEQAGGMASTGKSDILDIAPQLIHQRIPVIMGSREEVERVVSYHTKMRF